MSRSDERCPCPAMAPLPTYSTVQCSALAVHAAVCMIDTVADGRTRIPLLKREGEKGKRETLGPRGSATIIIAEPIRATALLREKDKNKENPRMP